MADRHERRRANLKKAIRAAKLDALLVTHPPNVSYLTGFSGDSSALLVGGDRALIVSDFRYETQLEEECPGLPRQIRPTGTTLAEELGKLIGKLGPGKVGVEGASLSVAGFETIRKAAGSTELEPTSGLVEELRAVKDADELAAIRRAIDAAERAYTRLIAGLRPGDDEADAADALEADLRRCGARGSSFPPIVAAGPRSALPHARPMRGAMLGASGFILIDWGAALGPLPYASDLTRVVATGKVAAKFEKVYRVVLEAQRRAIARIRPGVKGGDVDAEARSAIEEAGFGRFFGHGTGHGIGLEVHEAPSLRPGSEVELKPGMVVTIEPGIYLPGWGGIRIEDDVLVTPDGAEVLSTLPRDLDAARIAWAGAAPGRTSRG